MDVGRLLGAVTAVPGLAAGVLHLSAAGDHTDHEYAVVFFVGVAAFQLAWAAGTLGGRDGKAWLSIGAVVNVAVAGVWLLSRTSGVPLVPEVSEVEAVGVKDSLTTLLELLAASGAGVLALLPGAARKVALPSGERAVAAVAAGVFVLAVPGMLAGHSAGHAHTADGHGHTGVAAAASHAHDATAAAHGHNTTAAATSAHGHEGAAHATATSASHGHGAATSGHAAHGATETAAAAIAPQASHAVIPKDLDQLGRRATVRYPIPLFPNRLGGSQHRNIIVPVLPKPCEDCFITWMQPNLTFLDGTPAHLDRGLMLHHTVLFQTGKLDATCGPETGLGLLGERFFAAGNERTPLGPPPGYGYKVGALPWSGVFEIMNHSESFQLVFFDLEVRWRPASAKLKPVTPVWLDIDNCSDSAYAIPQGRSSQTWRWQSNLSGRVVSAGGHVHDGGIAITMSNRNTRERMCRSVAGYGTKPAYVGTIESMSTCVWDRLGIVRAGDVIELTTEYNSSTAQPDVMGILVAYVHETTDLAAGTPAPSDVVDPGAGQAPTAPPPAHRH